MYFYDIMMIFFLELLPPSFTVNPPNEMVVFAESKVNMTCEAVGIPVPVVTWYRDGTPGAQGKYRPSEGNLAVYFRVFYIRPTRRVLV